MYALCPIRPPIVYIIWQQSPLRLCHILQEVRSTVYDVVVLLLARDLSQTAIFE